LEEYDYQSPAHWWPRVFANTLAVITWLTVTVAVAYTLAAIGASWPMSEVVSTFAVMGVLCDFGPAWLVWDRWKPKGATPTIIVCA
jgi:hypothetical protein